MTAFRSAGAIAAKAAPALLAGLVTILTITILGIATAQIWWVTLLDCNAIAYALLLKGIDKTQRPDAEAIRAIEPEAPQEPKQAGAGMSEGPAASSSRSSRIRDSRTPSRGATPSPASGAVPAP